MGHMTDLLRNAGICRIPDLYTKREIDAINEAVNPLLASRLEDRRAYVHPDELLELGILVQVFNERMKEALFSIMPDPVLYHCHIYEIAANDSRSHIFSDSLLGWHRDPDSEFVQHEPTHISLFVYLTNVGQDDGAFEFVPDVPPSSWLRNGAPYIAVQGAPGYSFAWHRSYYHRASPNRGPVRRRLLKLSIQRNAFLSIHLGNPHFQTLLAQVPSGDVRWDMLLGRYYGKSAPQLPSPVPSDSMHIEPTNTLKLSSVDLTRAQVLDKARYFKRQLKGSSQPVIAAYD